MGRTAPHYFYVWSQAYLGYFPVGSGGVDPVDGDLLRPCTCAGDLVQPLARCPDHSEKRIHTLGSPTRSRCFHPKEPKNLPVYSWTSLALMNVGLEPR
jgi:hypothetical protein